MNKYSIDALIFSNIMTYQTNLISIIMPCYNDAQTIGESIDCILNQTYHNFELIIINDGSSDNTLEVLKKYQTNSKIKILSQKNSGAGPARNSGLNLATGEYIAFLDADDLWEPDFLYLMHEKLIESEVELVYCGWQNFGDSSTNSTPFIPSDYSSVDKLELLLSGNRWPIHGALIKHTIVEAAHGFDEDLTSCMDYDLWLRVTPFCNIALVPKVLAYYRFHDGIQITKNKAKIAINHWKVQQKFIKNNSELVKPYGKDWIRKTTHGELMRRGFAAYWNRDLTAARKIFRLVMRHGYGSIKNWMYMLPAILPLSLHTLLVKNLSNKK